MAHQNDDEHSSDLPAKLSQPARRALIAAGYTRLEQLTKVKESDLRRLHGMGPKGMALLRSELDARELAFADTEKG